MADFLLSVGADVNLSYEQMQKDITELVSRLNKNPQRVQVGLEIDRSAIESFRTEIANIHNSMNGMGRVTVSPIDASALNSTINGIERITENTRNAISAVHSMRAELDSVNTERIEAALASLNGVSTQSAAALARSLGEANVHVTSVRARLQESANTQQQLVNLQVRGTNEAGQTVNYLMTYNTKTGEIKQKLVDITARYQEIKQTVTDMAGATDEAQGNEEHRAVTLRQIVDLYRQMLSLMNTNQNANTAATYVAIAEQAEVFAQALRLAESEAISVDEALSRMGVDSTSAIEAARTAMSEFRLEMEQTGQSGAVNLTAMYNIVTQMQNLLNKNAGYADLPTYTNLQTQVELLTQAIRLATDGGMSLSQALDTVGLNGSTAILNAREAMSAFRAAASGASSSTEVLTEDNKRYAEAVAKVNALLVQVRTNTEKWTAAQHGKSAGQYDIYKDQARQLELLAQRLATGTMTAQQFNTEYSRIKITVDNTSSAIKGAGEATQTWSQRIGNLAEKFGTWFSITRVVMAAFNAIRKMVSAVTALDTAMTELKKVTDETDEVYNAFLVNASKRAKELGASLSDTVTATADFARLGFGIEDAEKLADAAIIYKNVGDGIENISEASESIIATMQAFGISAEDAMSIVDKFNEVGNNYAISSEGVGEALLRSAAAMKAANNTLDETIALAAAANTIVQNPETVGTTLKTVSMYLRAAKTEVEEAGESTDGMAASVSELRKELLALTGNRVDIQIDEDTFKSTYQILKELSGVWEDLSDITKANITELVGGKRNSNVVSALLENFSVAENALETSSQAAGSALAENEKYLDSINGKIAQFKSSFETFSQDLISSNLVKLIVDIGTGILTVLDGLQKLHLLLPSIITLATIVRGIGLSKQLSVTTRTLIANKAATENLIASVTKLTIAQKKKLVEDIKAAVASGALTQEQGAQILTTLGLATADGTLTIANKSLAASFKSLAASIPVWGWISLAISVVIEAILALTSATSDSAAEFETLNETLEQTTSEIKTISDNFSNLKADFDDTIPRFVELASGVNELGKNVSLTDEEYEEFLQLNNKIAEMFPELNLGMDETGNYMIALSYSSDTLKNSLYELLEAQRLVAAQEMAKKMPTVLDDIIKIEQGYKDDIAEIQSDISSIQSGTFTRSTFGDTYSAIADAKSVEEYYDYIDYLRGKGIEVTSDIENIPFTSGNIYTATWDVESSQVKNAIAGYKKEIDNLEAKIKSVWKQSNASVSAWLQSDYLYNDMGETMQDIAKAMVSGMDFNDLNLVGDSGEKTAENIQSYITKYIINPLYSASSEIKAAFEDAMSDLASGDITAEEFSAKIKEAFNSLLTGMDENEIENFKKSFIAGFNAMGIAGGNFDAVVNNIITNWSNSATSVVAGNDSMTDSITDLSEALKNLKSAYSLIATAQGEMATGGISADTISTLKSLCTEEENYLDYLYEENGLIKLNIDAWKERSALEMEDNIDAIEENIATLESERETLEERSVALQEAAVFVDSFIGALQPGQLHESEWTAAVEENNAALEANAAAIAANQAKLGIYTTLYNDITGSLDAYSAALQNFSNIANAITSVSDSLTTVADLQETVANGFTISLEKALEFAKVYPEILNGATVAADGQIALNEGIVNAFIEGKEAELKAQIDAGVAKLEADKAVLTAKMEFSKAQLELAKSVGTGEGQISKEVAEYRVNAGNAVAQALIAAGIDEATAYQLACAAMAQNSEEFNRIAAEVCTDVQGNFNQAAYDAAQAIYTNMQNSKQSIASVAAQAHQAAIAIAGIGSGTVQGSATVNGAAVGGSYAAKGNISVHSGTFNGSEYTYEAKTISLEDYISDLELDISNYSQAISQIDGQIATLKALRNTRLNKFSTSYKKENSESGSKSSSKDKEPTWFETEYALHQHLLKMDAENVEDYLDWLNSAYQRAYKEGIIELDDYRKYQEEVYSGLQDLFKDYLNDVEHEISMRKNFDGEDKKIISMYKSLIETVEKEIAAARARGLDDTDDYIQELQDKWASYRDSIEDIENEVADNAKDAFDELVDYQKDMLKQDIENQKDALDTKLDYLKEFYDKQKEMLQDQYDEEEYLKEQSEKRKSVSDIQAQLAQLEFDDSAWAQKRKAELQEELNSAQGELDDFEKQHALDMALDAIEDSYDAQEAQIQKEIDALDEELNNPELMFNKALQAIQENTGNLYQQMLEYNRKYGTGNDEDVDDIYEAAYKALLRYKELYGEDYEGVTLTNETGYKPDSGWDNSSVSGTNPDNQNQSPPPSSSSGSSNSSSTDAPSLTKGSSITVKKSATHFSAKSGGVRMASFVPGGKYTVYQTSGNEVLIGRDGVYTGWINKSDIVGYATGTRNATAGLHTIDEYGAETVFESKDGSRYKLFTGGEKVLNAKASEFLYDFANGSGDILQKIIRSALGAGFFDMVRPIIQHNDIQMGDIIVKGNADNQTVSAIRREQRSAVETMLKEFNKLNK